MRASISDCVHSIKHKITSSEPFLFGLRFAGGVFKSSLDCDGSKKFNIGWVDGSERFQIAQDGRVLCYVRGWNF